MLLDFEPRGVLFDMDGVLLDWLALSDQIISQNGPEVENLEFARNIVLIAARFTPEGLREDSKKPVLAQ